MEEKSAYHEGMRRLQDARETRQLADRLAQSSARTTFTQADRLFIQRCPMFFIATADADGRPDCWGNALINPSVGLLFIDFENPKRLRINGTAQLSSEDALRAEYPGSVFILRVTASRIFGNCPRYVHKMTLVEHSVYTPRVDHTPPVPEWKASEKYRDVLPGRDRLPHDKT